MQAASEVFRVSVIRVGNQIVTGSPVDKGSFINNWNTSIGGVSYEIKPDSKSGADSINELAVTMNGAQIGDTAYFSNPMPYGPRLEYDGWSEKAPNGMVRINTAKFNEIVNEEVLKRR